MHEAPPLDAATHPVAQTAVLPGATIGMLGGGQLGRMFTLAAKPLGYRVVVLTPEGDDAPACQVADDCIIATYDDAHALSRLAAQADVVTVEFENIPSQALTQLQDRDVPVFPSPSVLHICQHRHREKMALQQAGFPTVPFYTIPNRDALEHVPADCLPGVLKTAGFGYDGKGQIRVKNRFEVVAAFEKLDEQPCVLEAWMDIALEVSVVGARNQTGFAHFGVIENHHRNHILDFSVYPASVSDHLRESAIHLTQTLMDTLDVVGLLCVEFFVTRDGMLLINETAPRPHNSGHLTQNACKTSQFEQHVRAVCSLPLGLTDYTSPAAGMLNLLGDTWQAGGPPDWLALFAQFPEAKLHLYGKQQARAGRKMGHINVYGADLQVIGDQITRLKHLYQANC